MSSGYNENLRDTKSFCFGCGRKNPIGLKLKFKLTEIGCEASFTPDQFHQGFDGVVHGGITATVLDEAVANLFYQKNKVAMTAELDIRYHHPLIVGQKYRITARVVKQVGRLTYSETFVYDETGRKVVSAKAKQIEEK